MRYTVICSPSVTAVAASGTTVSVGPSGVFSPASTSATVRPPVLTGAAAAPPSDSDTVRSASAVTASPSSGISRDRSADSWKAFGS